jgi:rhodanese-related sulfurtransferase
VDQLMTLTTVEALLVQARAGIDRYTPAETQAAACAGAVLVDIRPLEQRRRDGLVPGAAIVGRNVLEWRLDPGGAHRDPALAVTDRPVILICDEGYQSSFAAATLCRFGVQAGDLVGGVQGWMAAGLALLPADPTQ